MTVAVEFRQVAGSTVIELTGHIDHGLARRLGDALAEVCRSEAGKPVVIDVSGVAVVDAVLAVALTERLQTSLLGDRVLIVSTRLSARRVLRRASNGVLRVYASVEDAARAQHALTQ